VIHSVTPASAGRPGNGVSEGTGGPLSCPRPWWSFGVVEDQAEGAPAP
jgi:hypothetical protein